MPSGDSATSLWNTINQWMTYIAATEVLKRYDAMKGTGYNAPAARTFFLGLKPPKIRIPIAVLPAEAEQDTTSQLDPPALDQHTGTVMMIKSAIDTAVGRWESIATPHELIFVQPPMRRSTASAILQDVLHSKADELHMNGRLGKHQGNYALIFSSQPGHGFARDVMEAVSAEMVSACGKNADTPSATDSVAPQAMRKANEHLKPQQRGGAKHLKQKPPPAQHNQRNYPATGKSANGYTYYTPPMQKSRPAKAGGNGG
jgi:hypothetical protein